jgi:hypothetical protein
VTPDHYATLQVSRTSEELVIRAAYLALMRRYHPDNNPSAHAAARSRAITTAYAVLGDPEKRADYDQLRAREEWAAETPPRRVSPRFLTLAAAAALMLLFIIPLMVDWTPLATSEQPDRLIDQPRRPTALPTALPKIDLAALCASRSAFDVVKREIFRQAAEVRGSDASAFERVARYSVIRVNAPILTGADQDRGIVSCKANVALDLPPGVVVGEGQRSLAGEIDYSVPAKDRSAPAVLADGGGIVSLLATLARSAPPIQEATTTQTPPVAPQQPLRQVKLAAQAPPPPQSKPSAAPPPIARAKAPPKAPTPNSRRGFSCRFSNVPGDVDTCNNADLSRLDGQLVSLYSQSWRSADPSKRALLQGTRDRFLGRRNGCRSNACVSGAYLGRMREISDIMIGSWHTAQ